MTADAEGWHLREFAGFLKELGNPQKELRIVHVAGTRGKGSTTRMISALLSSLGWRRVGSFTSPHIETFRERISIDNQPVSESDFVAALDAVRAARPPRRGEGFRTTFEVLTAMALWLFRERRCEAVVLETGLGGRLDSTNAARARVALLTTIGFEHQRVLGPTIGAIAREKAGIIKPGTGIGIVGPQLPRRAKTVVRTAAEQAASAGVPFESYDPTADDPILGARPMPWGFEVDLRVGADELRGVRLHALGRHQLDNLRGAWMAVRAFCRLAGRTIDPAGVRSGIEAFQSPGRLEIVHDDPLVLVDSAHCPISARAAMEACAEHFPGRPVILVLGLMRDKKPEAILKNLSQAGIVSAVFTHTPPTPRARAAEDLARLAAPYFCHVRSHSRVEEALESAMAFRRREPEALILVTGTAYSVAAARDWVELTLASA